MLLLFAVTTIGTRGFIELFPGFADRVFGRGPQGLAMLTSTVGLGAICGASWMVLRSAITGLANVVLVCTLIMSLAILAFTATDAFYLALPCVFVAGAMMTITGTGAQTLIQAAVDARMSGRVMALYGMIFRAALTSQRYRRPPRRPDTRAQTSRPLGMEAKTLFVDRSLQIGGSSALRSAASSQSSSQPTCRVRCQRWRTSTAWASCRRPGPSACLDQYQRAGTPRQEQRWQVMLSRRRCGRGVRATGPLHRHSPGPTPRGVSQVATPAGVCSTFASELWPSATLNLMPAVLSIRALAISAR